MGTPTRHMDSFDHYTNLAKKWDHPGGRILEEAKHTGRAGLELKVGESCGHDIWDRKWPEVNRRGKNVLNVSFWIKFPNGGSGKIFSTEWGISVQQPEFIPFHIFEMHISITGKLFFKHCTKNEPSGDVCTFSDEWGNAINGGGWHHIWVSVIPFTPPNQNNWVGHGDVHQIEIDGNFIEETTALDVLTVNNDDPLDCRFHGAGEPTYFDSVLFRAGEDGRINFVPDVRRVTIHVLYPDGVGSANNAFVATGPHWDAINDILPSGAGNLTSVLANELDDWDVQDPTITNPEIQNKWIAAQIVVSLKSTGSTVLRTFVIDSINNPMVTQPGIFLEVDGLDKSTFPAPVHNHVINTTAYQMLKWISDGEFANNIDDLERFRNTIAAFKKQIFGIKIVANQNSTLTIDQFVVEVAIPFVPEDENDPDDPSTRNLLIRQTHRFSKLWKIVRPDGVTVRFTNHNIDLVNPADGLTYTPVDSLRMSAYQRITGIDPSNIEMQGIIGTQAFNDFLAQKFNGTRITEYLLHWQYPWAGVIQSATFILDTLSYDAAKWHAEGSSISKVLLLPKGHVYGRTCRYVLGDDECKVSMGQLEETGSVLTVTNDHTKFESAIAQTNDAFGNARGVAGYWAFGNLTWTSGNNIGLKFEIRSHEIELVPENAIITLQTPTPFSIVSSDQFTIEPGCDKTLVTCRTKFQNPTDGANDNGNQKNYGGFPTIPGKDGIFAPLSGAERTFNLGQFFDFFGGFILP